MILSKDETFRRVTSNKEFVLNAFTVDLEDWFQGLTSTNPLIEQWDDFESRVVPMSKRLLDMLAEYNIQATFFVLGHVADQYPNLIEKIAADGHEIGVHGYWHRFVSRISPETFEQELDQSIKAIMRITGKPPIGHRAPYFSINGSTQWAFDCLQKFGIRYDSSVFPTRNMLYGYPEAPRFPYQIPNQSLVEFPASTICKAGVNWPLAGGFYLRLLPYLFFQKGIQQLNREGQPAILYMHPWELDLAQPAYPMTPRERITHLTGRRTLENKLHRLFSDFEFVPMVRLYEQFINHEEIKA